MPMPKSNIELARRVVAAAKEFSTAIGEAQGAGLTVSLEQRELVTLRGNTPIWDISISQPMDLSSLEDDA